ncbi:MAG: AraC family transcriptional regulator [Coleofasciculaceae cyanobacterium]
MMSQELVIDLTQESIWQQVALNPPLLSSCQTGWKGIHLAYHQQPPCQPHQLIEHRFAHHLIAVCLKNCEVRMNFNGNWQTMYCSIGDVGILPAYQWAPIAQCNQDIEFIHLYLEPKMLTRIAQASTETDRVELMPNFQVHDPLIQQIGLSLKAELERNRADSGLYAESMGVALSAHLLQRYTVKKTLLQSYTNGLPKHKLNEAIAYINDHLEYELSLTEIADLVKISPHYFATQFKQSTGLTPHQYVIQCRIERAKILLTNRELAITEVMRQTGFKSQSHFTRVFRQNTAITPKAYRDAI